MHQVSKPGVSVYCIMYEMVHRDGCTSVGAPQSTSQDRSQVVELPKSVRIRVWKTIPIGNTLQLQHVGDRDVGEVVFQYVISGNLCDLSNSSQSRTNERQTSIVAHTSPLSLNLAPLSAALSTPLGLQLNLYPSGTFDASGAGRPPQNEVNERTRLFSFSSCLSNESAEQWSIPGSKPISFNNTTLADSALGSTTSVSAG